MKTAPLDKNEEMNLAYIFYISQDEEDVELKIEYQHQVIDLNIRCHHYLTALLARYKKQLATNELSEGFKDWIPIKKLSRDLGLSESHINIQIHRARKQVLDKFEAFEHIVPTLIERRKGYLRFAPNNFKIYKGQTLEYQSVESTKKIDHKPTFSTSG